MVSGADIGVTQQLLANAEAPELEGFFEARGRCKQKLEDSRNRTRVSTRRCECCCQTNLAAVVVVVAMEFADVEGILLRPLFRWCG